MKNMPRLGKSCVAPTLFLVFLFGCKKDHNSDPSYIKFQMDGLPKIYTASNSTVAGIISASLNEIKISGTSVGDTAEFLLDLASASPISTGAYSSEPNYPTSAGHMSSVAFYFDSY